MSGWKLIAIWIACVIVGAIAGYALGWLLWKARLELIGSAVALVGAALGGFIMLYLVMRWSEGRQFR